MRRSILLLAASLALLVPIGAIAQTTQVRPYVSASPITPGSPVEPGNAVALACSAAGNERLVMRDGTFLDLYAQQGTAIIDNLSVKDVNAAASTATCTVTVLRSY